MAHAVRFVLARTLGVTIRLWDVAYVSLAGNRRFVGPLAVAVAAVVLSLAATASATALGTLVGQGCLRISAAPRVRGHAAGLAAPASRGQSGRQVGLRRLGRRRRDRAVRPRHATGALTPQGCVADVGDAAGCGVTRRA